MTGDHWQLISGIPTVVNAPVRSADPGALDLYEDFIFADLGHRHFFDLYDPDLFEDCRFHLISHEIYSLLWLFGIRYPLFISFVQVKGLGF